MTRYDIHPEMQYLVDQRRPLPPDPTIEEQRANWTDYAVRTNRPAPDSLEIEDVTLPCAHHPVPVRIYRHRGRSGPQHCVIYLHGGGFILGDLDSSDSVAWGYAIEAGATVVSVDYRLAPENPWPAGFDDCWGVVEWLAQNGAGLGIDPDRIALAGDSAGGRYAACVCQKARDLGGPRLRAQAIVYGNGGPVPNAASMRDFAEGFGLTAARTANFVEMLFPADRFPDGPPVQDPHCYPVFAESCAGLPPTLIHCAEFDPIRDAGRVYAARLVQDGVDVTYREARGMIHGFMRVRFVGRQAAAEFSAISRFLADHLT